MADEWPDLPAGKGYPLVDTTTWEFGAPIQAQLNATTGGLVEAGIAPTRAKVSSLIAPRTRRDLPVAASTRFCMQTEGDSISEGQGASTVTTRWATIVARALATTYGGGKLGEFIPALYFAPNLTDPAAVTGTPTVNGNYGPGGRAQNLVTANGDSLTWTINALWVDVFYSPQATGGTFTVHVDGALVATVDTVASANSDGAFARYNLGSLGSHTVKVTAATGTVIVDGIVRYEGAPDRGVVHIDAGWAGSRASHHQGGSGGTSMQKLVRATGTNLVFVALTANDYSNATDLTTYRTQITTIVNKMRASGMTPDIHLVVVPKRTGVVASYTPYVEINREVAQALGCGFIDLNAIIGTCAEHPELFPDGVHPNDAGHALIAEIILDAIDTGAELPATVPGESVFIPATAFYPTAGTPVVQPSTGSAVSMRFDWNTQETVVAHIPIPPGWTKANIVYWLINPFADTGVIIWRAIPAYFDPVTGAFAGGNDVSVSYTAAAQNVHDSLVMAEAVPLLGGRLARITVTRMAAGAADTFPNDAGLIGVQLVRA